METLRSDSPGRAPRLLVVSYFFPPSGPVGALRWGALTKYLARAGWPVHVLTAQAGADAPEHVDGRQVHRVRRARTLNDRYQGLVKGRNGGSRPPTASPPADDSRGSLPARRLFRLRRAIAAVMGYPDHSRGWLVKAAYMARRIVAKEEIDIVVSSGPPHTAHVAAMLATIGTRVRWVIDMRDPWAEMLEKFQTDAAPAFLHGVTRWLESKAFARCDRIVCNTQAYAEVLIERGVGPVSWIPNGIDSEDLPERREPGDGPTVLAYVGTLYFNRDLAPVLKAMALCGKSGDVPQGIKLRFAGYAPPAHASALHHQMAEYGLEDGQVERLGRLPRDQARSVLSGAHLGVVLAQGQPMQVPAKLYETVGMGLPTLVLAERRSATALEAKRLGTIWRDPADVEGIAAVIRDVANGGVPSRTGAREIVDYRTIALGYADILREVMG